MKSLVRENGMNCKMYEGNSQARTFFLWNSREMCLWLFCKLSVDILSCKMSFASHSFLSTLYLLFYARAQQPLSLLQCRTIWQIFQISRGNWRSCGPNGIPYVSTKESCTVYGNLKMVKTSTYKLWFLFCGYSIICMTLHFGLDSLVCCSCVLKYPQKILLRVIW